MCWCFCKTKGVAVGLKPRSVPSFSASTHHLGGRRGFWSTIWSPAAVSYYFSPFSFPPVLGQEGDAFLGHLSQPREKGKSRQGDGRAGLMASCSGWLFPALHLFACHAKKLTCAALYSGTGTLTSSLDKSAFARGEKKNTKTTPDKPETFLQPRLS